MSLNRVFVAGTSLVTAADMNGLQAAWDTYTPTLSNMAVGNGAIRGRYYRQGKTVVLRVFLQAGSTTTYTSSGVTVSLPFAAHGTDEQELGFKVYDVATTWPGLGIVSAAGSIAALYVTTAANDARLSGMNSSSNRPGTVGNFVLYGTYEAA